MPSWVLRRRQPFWLGCLGGWRFSRSQFPRRLWVLWSLLFGSASLGDSVSDIDARFDDLAERFSGSGERRGVLDKAADFIRLAETLLEEGIDRAEVTEAVKRNWERIVVPYNIPWVPEFIERVIEERALNSILEVIAARSP